MDHPPLPGEIVVLPGTDVAGEWERFLPFEALHHGMTICNPMTDRDLDSLIAALDVNDGERVVDIACGHGELLMRLASHTRIEAVGVDLSPWVLTRAAHSAARRTLAGTIEWWLGTGSAVPKEPQWDVAMCLGGSWIWHGFGGTVSALAARVRQGGLIAVGDLRLRPDADPSVLDHIDGAVMTGEVQRTALAASGLEPVEDLVAPDSSWRAYHRRVIDSAEEYAARYPGDATYDHRAMAGEWLEEFERDRKVLSWAVTLARKL